MAEISLQKTAKTASARHARCETLVVSHH